MTTGMVESLPDSLSGGTRQMLIGGDWVDAASGRAFETLNPATGEVLAHVPLADAGGHRPRGAGRAAGVRERARGRRMTAVRARPADLDRIGDLILEHCGGARRARDRSTTASRSASPAPPTCRWPPTCSTTWPAGRPRSRATRSRCRCPTRPARVPRLHAARAGRRGRADHPVELPAADGGLEARARAGRRAARSCSSPPSRRR